MLALAEDLSAQVSGVGDSLRPLFWFNESKEVAPLQFSARPPMAVSGRVGGGIKTTQS
jgi:hypothetical protein